MKLTITANCLGNGKSRKLGNVSCEIDATPSEFAEMKKLMSGSKLGVNKKAIRKALNRG